MPYSLAPVAEVLAEALELPCLAASVVLAASTHEPTTGGAAEEAGAEGGGGECMRVCRECVRAIRIF